MRSHGFRKALVCIAATAFVVASGMCTEEAHDISRYQIIIDRSPFGAIPGSANAAQPNFSTRFVLVGLVDSNSAAQQLQAIIMDKEKNSTYFKSEGESIEDVKILHIESKPAKVVIQKELETATLTYADRPNSTGPSPAGTPQAPPGFAPPNPARVGGRIPFRRGN